MKDIDEFLEYLLVVRKHSMNTINNYRIDLEDFYLFNDKDLFIDKDIVYSYLNFLYERNVSKNTIMRKLSSLRSFYNYLVMNKRLEVNYFKLIKNPRKDKSLPKYVRDDDIDKMFLIPDTRNAIGKRNLLIIRMLYASGIRVSELINIKINDINISDRTIRILGKGNKERIVIFGNNTKDALVDYLDNGRVELDKKDSEYLFLNYLGGRLSSRYVRDIINDIIFKASIDMHVSPHMLRHTFATQMLNNGADLVSVKEILGHSSLNTTSIYTHVSDDKIREVYNMAHPRAR